MSFTLPLSVLVIYVLWRVGYRRLLLDAYRSRLFRLRDELFDAARAGRLDFEGKAYRITRASLNARLRFAHRVSLTDLVALKIFSPGFEDAVDRVAVSRGEVALAAETLQGRRVISSIEQRADEVSALYFAATTPFVWVFSIGFIFAFAAGDFARRLRLLGRKLADFDAVGDLVDYPLVEERSEHAYSKLTRGGLIPSMATAC